jgi:ketosteroid isomerase-like protein
MSEENVELIRRVYAGVTARKATPRELLASDYEVDAGELSPERGWPRGYEAAEEAMSEYWQTFDDFHVDLEEVIHADEERVVTAVRDGGRMSGSEQEVWNHFFHVWTISGGKIARLSIHNDRERALRAAGLSE